MHEIELEFGVFEKKRRTRRKTLGARKKTNNNLNLHVKPGPRINSYYEVLVIKGRLGNPDLDFEIRFWIFLIKHEIQNRDFALSEIHLSVTQNLFLDFMFYWEILNPDFKIQIRISQSKTPENLSQ